MTKTGSIDIDTPQISFTLRATDDGELWLHLRPKGFERVAAFQIRSDATIASSVIVQSIQALAGVRTEFNGNE